MSILRKALLFGGWIPALGGGGAAVWWLESDRTIEDVLRRTEREILWSNSDFQKLYLLFEDDPQFSKDIENIESLGPKGLSEWCKEKLSLPITEENLKEFLPKTHKYCSIAAPIVVPNNIKDYRNFKNIFTILRKDGNVNLEKMSGAIVHLSNSKKDDVYYSFKDNKEPEKSELTSGQAPENILGRKIFMPSGKKMLSKDKNKETWVTRIKKYIQEGSQRFADLKEVWDLEKWEEENWDFKTYNLLGDQCEKALKKDYPNAEYKSEFELEQKLFDEYCTVSIDTEEN